MATVLIKPELEAGPAVRQPHPSIPPEHLPNYDALVTEDDQPVDNTISERQMRLLADALYASWQRPGEDKRFLAFANVGLFYSVYSPPLVPDFLLSLDVDPPTGNLMEKRNRSYFIWEYGKPPEVVIEIVSNREGGEDTSKLSAYARIGVMYYVIFDPNEELRADVLRVYELSSLRRYEALSEPWLSVVGLGLTLWEGAYQDVSARWLRWCDREGNLLLTGAERAEHERQRAEQQRQRAEQAEARIARLVAQLRAAGIEPANGESHVE